MNLKLSLIRRKLSRSHLQLRGLQKCPAVPDQGPDQDQSPSTTVGLTRQTTVYLINNWIGIPFANPAINRPVSTQCFLSDPTMTGFLQQAGAFLCRVVTAATASCAS
jgi:hypothetical protein